MKHKAAFITAIFLSCINFETCFYVLSNPSLSVKSFDNRQVSFSCDVFLETRCKCVGEGKGGEDFYLSMCQKL